jgi:hypothetical protein
MIMLDLYVQWESLRVHQANKQDATDLSIQSGQIVNVLEKTSEDCKLLMIVWQ